MTSSTYRNSVELMQALVQFKNVDTVITLFCEGINEAIDVSSRL
jgi:hypothetical protein